jgi:hypothetical protein
MPVWVVDEEVEKQPRKNGKRLRHIDKTCTILLQTPADKRSKDKGSPNTEKLRGDTVRCDSSPCQKGWDEVDAEAKREKRVRTKATGGKAKATKGKKAAQPGKQSAATASKGKGLAARARPDKQKAAAPASPAPPAPTPGTNEAGQVEAPAQVPAGAVA